MVSVTFWTVPFTDAKVLDFRVLISATMTELGGWEETVNLYDGYSALQRNPFQNFKERGESIVSCFLPMSFHHEFVTQVL